MKINHKSSFRFKKQSPSSKSSALLRQVTYKSPDIKITLLESKPLISYKDSI
jgi:hypothetical protein